MRKTIKPFFRPGRNGGDVVSVDRHDKLMVEVRIGPPSVTRARFVHLSVENARALAAAIVETAREIEAARTLAEVQRLGPFPPPAPPPTKARS
jgi:hypothetical protein